MPILSTHVLQIRSNGQITLPSSVRRSANLQEGDLLEIIVEPDGSLRLIPKVAVDRSQAYFFTERWQRGEREAEEDLRAGRYQDFNSMDELITSLEDDMESK
jgi:AbrB family looped-hinge helix DNA binding protein